MKQFRVMTEKAHFWAILGQTIIFPKIPPRSVFSLYSPLTSCKISEETHTKNANNTLVNVGLSKCRSIEMSDYRDVGLSRCRTIEMSDYRDVGLSRCRTIEMSDYRFYHKSNFGTYHNFFSIKTIIHTD